MATQTLPKPIPIAWMRNRWLLIALALLVAVAIVATTLTIRSRDTATVATTPVVRQTLTQTVTASGTVTPQNEVTVGTQISGTISALYVDYNSKVKKGQVLARIDTSTLQAQLAQAQANLSQAQAQAQAQVNTAAAQQAAVPGAAAAVTKAQSALKLAQTTLTRDRSLLAQGYLAASQVQADQDAVVSAQAALQTAQSQATQAGATANGSGYSTQAAQAAIAAQAASVEQDQLNMDRAVITSPVDGIVIDREISVGQTVAASLQTPTLFTIAQNLNKMQVGIAVGEPDIGSMKAGQSVDFTVLAYPNRTYHGTVTQVRDNPVTTTNVVTYTVITSVNNPDGSLLPGMTANATIQVASAPNALVVPAQALHQKRASGNTASPWGTTSSTTPVTPQAGSTATLLVRKGGTTQPVRVKVTMVSGTQAAVTPITANALAVGDEVVTAASDASASTSGHTGRSPASGGRGAYGAMRGIH